MERIFPIPMRSYTVKDSIIGSAVSEILRYIHIDTLIQVLLHLSKDVYLGNVMLILILIE